MEKEKKQKQRISFWGSFGWFDIVSMLGLVFALAGIIFVLCYCDIVPKGTQTVPDSDAATATATRTATATVSSPSSWDFHGIDMSGIENVDLYYLEITLPSASIYTNERDSADSLPMPEFWKRANADVLFKFTFPNLKYTDKVTGKTETVFLMQTFYMNCHERGAITIWARYDFVNGATLKFSLTNNYYKWLKEFSDAELKSAFSNFTIHMLHEGVPQIGTGKVNQYMPTMHTTNKKSPNHNGTIRLYSESTDSGVFNPKDDNFQLEAGNNGSNLQPEPSPQPDNNGFNLWQWLADLFGKPVATIMAVVAIIILIIGFFFLVKLIRWAVKK